MPSQSDLAHLRRTTLACPYDTVLVKLGLHPLHRPRGCLQPVLLHLTITPISSHSLISDRVLFQISVLSLTAGVQLLKAVQALFLHLAHPLVLRHPINSKVPLERVFFSVHRLLSLPNPLLSFSLLISLRLLVLLRLPRLRGVTKILRQVILKHFLRHLTLLQSKRWLPFLTIPVNSSGEPTKVSCGT